MKRASEQFIEDSGNEEKRSRLGYKPENVKQAEEDQSAVVHTEVRAILKSEKKAFRPNYCNSVLVV